MYLNAINNSFFLLRVMRVYICLKLAFLIVLAYQNLRTFAMKYVEADTRV